MPVSEACEATLLSTIFGTGDLTPILGGASPEAASWTVRDDHPLREKSAPTDWPAAPVRITWSSPAGMATLPARKRESASIYQQGPGGIGLADGLSLVGQMLDQG
jgi:hypothetical protein